MAPGEYAETLSSLFARHADGVYVEQPGGYNPDEGESAPINAPVTVKGYLPLDATTDSRRAMIDVGVRLVSYLSPLPPMGEREVDQSEWSSQSFEPIRVGKRLVIVPPSILEARRLNPLSHKGEGQGEGEARPTGMLDSHPAPASGHPNLPPQGGRGSDATSPEERARVREKQQDSESSGLLSPGDIVIPLEPGLAFGTGHHPTTAMMLTSMEQLVTPGCRVLDVGCGSGILMIAANKLGAGLVVGCDVEDDAIISSRRNLALAGIDDGVAVFSGSLPSGQAPSAAFDLVLANISATVIRALAGELLAPLKADGRLLASGILQPRMQEVVEVVEAAGGRLIDHEITGDWCRLTFERA